MGSGQSVSAETTFKPVPAAASVNSTARASDPSLEPVSTRTSSSRNGSQLVIVRGSMSRSFLKKQKPEIMPRAYTTQAADTTRLYLRRQRVIECRVLTQASTTSACPARFVNVIVFAS